MPRSPVCTTYEPRFSVVWLRAVTPALLLVLLSCSCALLFLCAAYVPNNSQVSAIIAAGKKQVNTLRPFSRCPRASLTLRSAMCCTQVAKQMGNEKKEEEVVSLSEVVVGTMSAHS